jgi:EmrB/QacA subfamily drug resistance transporter
LIFTITSGLCGAAPDVLHLVPPRFVQGFGKGMVVATVLAIMWREFPEKKDLAMAFYGIGIYFGKAIAPSIGGYLTDHPSWRWIFYIDVPLGLATFLLSLWVLTPDKPTTPSTEPFDRLGFLLLTGWVAALAICLYRGQKWGWFTSNAVLIVMGSFLTLFLTWVIWELRVAAPLIDLRLFEKRTFALAEGIKSLFAINFYGVFSLLAGYMVTLRLYPRETSGLVLVPGALTFGLSLIVSGLIATRWDRKQKCLLGMAGMALATWQLSCVDLYTDKVWLAVLFAFWGLAAGFVVSPVIVMPLEGLTQSQIVSSATIKNMVRVLPGAIGSGLVAILMTRRHDAYFDTLRQNITYNRGVLDVVNARLADHLAARGSSGDAILEQTRKVIGGYVQDNAAAFAYQIAFQFLALAALVGTMLVVFIPPTQRRAE